MEKWKTDGNKQLEVIKKEGSRRNQEAGAK